MDYIDVEVKNVGKLKILPTDTKHVYICNVDRSWITINNVNYYIGAHLYKWDDGQWHWGSRREESFREPHLRRVEPTGNRDYNPSSVGRAKAGELILEFMQKWIQENPGKMREAERDDLEARLGKAKAEHKAAAEELQKKGQAVADLTAELEKFE